jgi:hypothetical protein
VDDTTEVSDSTNTSQGAGLFADTAADSSTQNQYLEVSFHPLHELQEDFNFAWTLSHHKNGTTQTLSIDPNVLDSLYQDGLKRFLPSKSLKTTLKTALSNHSRELGILNDCLPEKSPSTVISRMIETMEDVNRVLGYSLIPTEADGLSHGSTSAL